MKNTLLFLILVWTSGVYAQTAVGTWKTIDDQTGEAKSLIEIYEKGGKLYGKVAKVLRANAEPLCKTCSGERANQAYLGMEIISGAKADGPKEWEGKIYDPETDRTYSLIMWLEKDLNVLYVRGKHWTGLYRTQTWKRA